MPVDGKKDASQCKQKIYLRPTSRECKSQASLNKSNIVQNLKYKIKGRDYFNVYHQNNFTVILTSMTALSEKVKNIFQKILMFPMKILTLLF